MNPSSGNPGLNKLAQTLQHQMGRNQEANSALLLDFGHIQSDYSLVTNTYPVPIPKGDYMVCRQLTIGPTGGHLTVTGSGEGSHSHGGGDHQHDQGTHGGHDGGDGSHDHDGGEHSHSGDGDHIHNVLIPEKMRKLLPGDRVLVAWIQADAVVIDLVLPASVL